MKLKRYFDVLIIGLLVPLLIKIYYPFIMKFVLDSLQLITQYQVQKEGFVVNFHSYVIVDTYAVKYKQCNVRNVFFIILSDGHHIVRALLNISKNCDGSLLQFGDIITINQYTTVVTKET